MNWLIQRVFEWKVVPKILSPLIWLYGMATHHRTEILAAVWLVCYLLESWGTLPKGIADQLETAIGGGAVLTFLDKIKRYGGPALEKAKREAHRTTG